MERLLRLLDKDRFTRTLPSEQFLERFGIQLPKLPSEFVRYFGGMNLDAFQSGFDPETMTFKAAQTHSLLGSSGGPSVVSEQLKRYREDYQSYPAFLVAARMTQFIFRQEGDFVVFSGRIKPYDIDYSVSDIIYDGGAHPNAATSSVDVDSVLGFTAITTFNELIYGAEDRIDGLHDITQQLRNRR